jgi:hypothetical protein
MHNGHVIYPLDADLGDAASVRRTSNQPSPSVRNARHVHFSLKFFFTYYVDQRGPTDGCVLGEMVMECCMQSNFVYRSSDFSESRLNFRGATVSV